MNKKRTRCPTASSQTREDKNHETDEFAMRTHCYSPGGLVHADVNNSGLAFGRCLAKDVLDTVDKVV